MGYGEGIHVYISRSNFFLVNSKLKSLGKFDLLKTVERLQKIEEISGILSDHSTGSVPGYQMNETDNFANPPFQDPHDAESTNPSEQGTSPSSSTEVQESVSQPQDENISIQQSASTSWSSHVELDFSVGKTVYDYMRLSRAEIVSAVRQCFMDDEGMKLIAPPRKDITVWKIHTTNIDRYNDVKHVTDKDGKVMADVQIKRVKQQFDSYGTVRRSVFSANPPTDLLITLKDADTDRFANVTDEMITKKIVDMGIGSIKKAVRFQAHPGTDCPCGNKFFVLENVSEVDRKNIPQSFDFLDHGNMLRMWLNYRGKPRRCRFCSEFHDNASCPKEEAVRKMEKERDDIKAKNNGTLPIKTYTDSTLRLVQQKSLASDVDAMSGAATGNLINAIDVDPDNQANAVLIVGGQNELHRRMSTVEFAHTVLQKERNILEISKQKRVVLLAPPSQDFVDTTSIAKEEYFHESLAKLDESENITVLDNPVKRFDDDGGRHPSADQTVEIIKFLDTKLKDILDIPFYLLPSATDETVVTRKYFGVTPLYRFGCSGCMCRKKNKWDNLCDDCLNGVNGSQEMEAAERIEKRAEALFNLSNPPLNDDSDNESLVCEGCDVQFASGNDIRNHFKEHHPDTEFVMPTLRDKFKYQDGGNKSRRSAVFKSGSK